MASLIAGNGVLTELDLSSNYIKDTGAKAWPPLCASTRH